MKRKLPILIMLLFTLFSFNSNFGVAAAVAEKGQAPIVEVRELDKRAKILSDYLSKYNSPLQYHSQDFVDAADQYGLDWKMLPAIAGVESTFGKHIPGGYNAYGWAIYNSSSRFGFKSWRDGMFTVAKGLRENYLNRGLNNPYQMNRVYAASPHWGGKVTYFMNDLEKFATQYELENKTLTDMAMPVIQIAVISGQVALSD